METRRQQHKRQRKDNQNQQDIISGIPDCLLIHILSFLNAKQAVQTCILSKRWINLWKTLPTLILRRHSDFSRNDTSLEQFLDGFLSLRDHSAPIRAFSFHGLLFLNFSLTQRVIEYALSHGVQHLGIKLTTIKHLSFSSHTLTYLRLSAHCIAFAPKMIFPNSLNLPALTTLSLKHFSFSRTRNSTDDDGCVVDPFSAFNMLNTLIIDCCLVLDNAQNLRITGTNLVNLTIRMYNQSCVPKTYKGTSFGIELYTPTLHTFAFTSNQYIHKLSGSKSILSSIKHASILFSCHNMGDNPSTLLNWLVELANIESLTVSHHTLKVLSNFHDLSKVELPSLYNLKSLKIKTYLPSYIPPRMVDFLLQNSPSATVDTISLLGQRETV